MNVDEFDQVIAKLERVTDLLQQIVVLLKTDARKDTFRAPITVTIDSREIAQQVVRYSLTRAARAPSWLIGGVLPSSKKGIDGHPPQ